MEMDGQTVWAEKQESLPEGGSAHAARSSSVRYISTTTIREARIWPLGMWEAPVIALSFKQRRGWLATSLIVFDHCELCSPVDRNPDQAGTTGVDTRSTTVPVLVPVSTYR